VAPLPFLWSDSWRAVSNGKDPMLEQEKRVRSPHPEDGVAEKTCDELTATLIPCPPVPLGGRR